jgi:hypothetical protein
MNYLKNNSEIYPIKHKQQNNLQRKFRISNFIYDFYSKRSSCLKPLRPLIKSKIIYKLDIYLFKKKKNKQ